MAVYREGYSAVELIQSSSKRIYSDSIDFGAPTKKGDKIWMAAQQLIEWYGNEETRKENRYQTGSTVSCEAELMWEWDGPRRGKIERFLVTFTTTRDLKRKGGIHGFVSVKQL